MLTKERTGMTRKFKYAAVALALLAVLVFCFASCGKATPTGIEYVTGTAAKVEYNPGETFDCTGAQVKVTYDNGVSETVAVTPEMVGNAPLTLGIESISVTYSENGSTVIGHIPVSVVDPNAKLKSDTIAALNANAKVLANNSDAGVGLLVSDYAAQIKTATSADAVKTLATAFEADLTKYLDSKDAIVAQFGAAELTAKVNQLYDQFKKDIDSAKATAIANVKAASTIDEANDYLAAFTVAVDNKLAEQNYYESAGNKGQIHDKIALLNRLEVYESEIANFERIVRAATDSDPEAKANALALYESLKYGNSAEGIKGISYLKKYITLAIDLGSIDLQAEVGDRLITDVDHAVEKILAKEKITIRPLAYVEGALAETSETQELLTAVENEFKDAVKIFGTAGVEELKAKYGQPEDATSYDNNFINILIDKIQTRYNELNAIRAAIEEVRTDGTTGDDYTVNTIVELIQVAYDKDAVTELDAKKDAINAAWDAVIAWNDVHGVFTIPSADEIVYDAQMAATIYTATGFDAEKKVWTTVESTWEADPATNIYVETYFIPNIDLLVKASQQRDAQDAKILIANDKLDEVIFSYKAEISSADEIRKARAALDGFKDKYGAEIYNEFFVVGGADAFETRVATAEGKLDTLIGKAADANAAIDAYELVIGNNVANIKAEHYSKDADLKKAYTLYSDFALSNFGYTDVIENTEAGEDTDNETNLLVYMAHYAEFVAHKNERESTVNRIINTAWAAKDEALAAAYESVFRPLLSDFKDALVTYIENQSKYDYVALPDGLEVEGVAVTAENAKFYYEAILTANKNMLVTAANTAAATITAATTEADLVNPLA